MNALSFYAITEPINLAT